MSGRIEKTFLWNVVVRGNEDLGGDPYGDLRRVFVSVGFFFDHLLEHVDQGAELVILGVLWTPNLVQLACFAGGEISLLQSLVDVDGDRYFFRLAGLAEMDLGRVKKILWEEGEYEQDKALDVKELLEGSGAGIFMKEDEDGEGPLAFESWKQCFSWLLPEETQDPELWAIFAQSLLRGLDVVHRGLFKGAAMPFLRERAISKAVSQLLGDGEYRGLY